MHLGGDRSGDIMSVIDFFGYVGGPHDPFVLVAAPEDIENKISRG